MAAQSGADPFGTGATGGSAPQPDAAAAAAAAEKKWYDDPEMTVTKTGYGWECQPVEPPAE